MIAAPAWRRLIRAPAAGWVDGEIEADGHELESEVDVHAFAPGQLRDLARGAGFDEVRLRGEELLANAYGWVLRTLEATAEPESRADGLAALCLPQLPGPAAVDTAVLEPRLPPELFYNLVLSARRPD